MLKRFFVCLTMMLSLGIAQADELNDIKAKLESALSGIKIDSISKLDNTGLYETVINGEVIYFSADARYIFQGDVTSIETRTNVTEAKRTSIRKQVLASLDESDMIVYEPEKTEHTLTVFTDIDCGYCRKLHLQMSEYTDLGIRIRYMAYPRDGIDSRSYDKAVAVWCADDRKQAMTDAKNGKDVESEACNSPVRSHFESGRQMGVNGTPALFLESGQLLPGYVPPARLKQLLDQRAEQSRS